MPENVKYDSHPDPSETDYGEPERQRFYSLVEVAKAFGRSPRTIRWWVNTGRLKTFAIGRSKYVSEAELERLMAGGEG